MVITVNSNSITCNPGKPFLYYLPPRVVTFKSKVLNVHLGTSSKDLLWFTKLLFPQNKQNVLRIIFPFSSTIPLKLPCNSPPSLYSLANVATTTATYQRGFPKSHQWLRYCNIKLPFLNFYCIIPSDATDTAGNSFRIPLNLTIGNSHFPNIPAAIPALLLGTAFSPTPSVNVEISQGSPWP